MQILLLVLLLTAGNGAAGVQEKGHPIPGQKQFIVIDDSFRFIQGAWASYTILEKAKQQDYTMQIAVLEHVVKKGKPLTWMEVAVEMPGQPGVVTRMLVEETPQGPGEISEMIVQVAGYSPFRVPKKYYNDPKTRQAGAVQTVVSRKRLNKCDVDCGGQTVSAWELEAEAADGTPIRAVVSEEVAPIGVCFAETADVAMRLTARGSDAKTGIHGSPRSFTLWILEQLADGLSQEPK
ncbi:MAG: hypothetical protein EHM61_25460 [Acidobacteria bacterium]|nr:MAG: hypothetical protein EHM61_25460 [Acidobacteriota bacterium]